MMSWLLVFAIMFVLDIVWARYTAALVAKRIGSASSYAAFIAVLSGVSTISYVNDHWLLVPAAFGAFAGTALGMLRQ